jgi:hypothetical protein
MPVDSVNRELNMKTRVPLWKKSVGPKHDIGGFFRSNDRILSILGAIIVFFTFIVREGARERFKDIADSRRGAQKDYLSSEKLVNLGVQDLFLEFEWQIMPQMNLLDKSNSDEQDRILARVVAKVLPDVSKLLTTFGNELDDLTEVAQSLDHPEEFRAPLDKLKHRLEGFEQHGSTMAPQLTSSALAGEGHVQWRAIRAR